MSAGPEPPLSCDLRLNHAAIRNQMLGLLGAMPTIFGDILGDGTVDINDYTAVRKLIGTQL